MRWLIRYEPVRTPKFGETRRDVSEWVVRAYIVRDGKRVFAGKKVGFPSLRTAHRWATAAALVHSNNRRHVFGQLLSESARRRPINITTIAR